MKQRKERFWILQKNQRMLDCNRFPRC